MGYRHICSEKYYSLNIKNWRMMNNCSWATQSSPKLRKKERPYWSGHREGTHSERCAACYDIRKNLISGSILSKKDFRMVFESDKFVLTEGGVYVHKGYLIDSLFKANVVVMNKKSVYLYPKLINKGKSSFYLFESSILWHVKLGHENYKSLQNLSNIGYISKLNLKEICKCEICVEVKFAKNSFHSIDWNTEPLWLIHSDLCDLKFASTRDE